MKNQYEYWAIKMPDGFIGCLRTEEWCSDFESSLGPHGAYQGGKIVPVKVTVRKITPRKHSNKPTVAQKEFLIRHHIDPKKYKTKDECCAIISHILKGFKQIRGLA